MEIPKCVLVTCVPFLADAPLEWQVSLVDTPGFGEFESHVETLATEALKSSSAYMYITTYADLHSTANAANLKFILQHDQGMVCIMCVLQSVNAQLVMSLFNSLIMPRKCRRFWGRAWASSYYGYIHMDRLSFTLKWWAESLMFIWVLFMYDPYLKRSHATQRV